jgi:uncharacterized membrane protein YgcG
MRAAVLICLAVYTSATSPRALPSPARDSKACGWASADDASLLCDPDGLLSVEEKQNIARLLDDVSTNLADPACDGKPFQIGIAIVRASELRVTYSSDGAVADARRLLDDWGVGQKNCNNGVVLLLAMAPRKFALYGGGGAERAGLSEHVREAILDRMRSPLRAGKTYDALARSIVDISDALTGHSDRFITKWTIFWRRVGSWMPYILPIVLFALFASVIMWRKRVDANRIAAIRARLDSIDAADLESRNAAAEERAARFESPGCPICLEPFRAGYNLNTVVLLECGHKVCKVGEGGVGDGCAQRWFGGANLIQKGSVHYALSQTPHSTCPVCRADCTVPRGDDGTDADGAADGAGTGAPSAGHGGVTRTGLQYSPDPASRSGGVSARPSGGASTSYQRSATYSSGARSARRRHFYTDAGLGYDHGYDLRRERLRHMQRRYPAYISTTQVNDLSRDWMSGASRGALDSSSASSAWHSDLLATRRAAARVASASRHSGSSSSSFGGGSSSGGGGSGGGW